MTKTHFGFEDVEEAEKATKVAQVFHSVANKYDLMNDFMSFGLHRVWKKWAITCAQVKPGQVVLDIAGGTGDLAAAFARAAQWGNNPSAEVWLSDINASMLGTGRDRLLDQGLMLPCVQFDAEAIPFPSNHFDVLSVAFGLRNMTHKEVALSEMLRVIKPGGKVLVLEFSQPDRFLQPLYDVYSFKVLPWLGEKIAKDAASYRYLAESIRMHPDAKTLKAMMLGLGFDEVDTHRLSGGIVALHIGVKY
ncbi:bifunctional demethylmenaquinone methyltransferase/2-methoxy-6-polyprenyl-1,4-benzoquinol methylase UbiE [Polynucleobacter sp. IMCC30063]|uniref:bifunctional demethylmenaquinone methyltransferase/2-methoxy-6-polyprenyl-1,4-benzoquinol methylase UbiE n=1 Tax=unclassified Polynucleobacter TaxID=2640945 RepID=UPI001F1C6F87|nr:MULTISPECIES: bifunctional demethylmenaquinone methyltransferase/2-methoxy-6-polyprenyl-1,4-benzoquinol methylase UbiE [unclassified Polynucleobacter]MCE7504675.1 bifunctional demethylmenaquinone methyltransferase/2-methoxy-6-polyprenyl-1,4-benzoquinol methylase UbiE [Polynucleobacter sp. IMCC30063]MCE7529807.1 bifunctional demethylmenaquinone methyltransferase/2-methoxy-6-polyprenyl-1,4-benzoquinol methylase UbiE [Polynucleobacter sp. IMCC 29146]